MGANMREGLSELLSLCVAGSAFGLGPADCMASLFFSSGSLAGAIAFFGTIVSPLSLCVASGAFNLGSADCIASLRFSGESLAGATAILGTIDSSPLGKGAAAIDAVLSVHLLLAFEVAAGFKMAARMKCVIALRPTDTMTAVIATDRSVRFLDRPRRRLETCAPALADWRGQTVSRTGAGLMMPNPITPSPFNSDVVSYEQHGQLHKSGPIKLRCTLQYATHALAE